MRIKQRGNFNKMETFLNRAKKFNPISLMHRYGQEGVNSLASATPKSSGETATSWDYRVVKDGSTYRLEWFNTHAPNGVRVALLLQYGHATRNGTWIEGKDYINPAIKPILDKISNDIWREVTGR